ncbi:MAG: glycosyltransferase family 2 protein [Candidatus Omnitrophota bacterium]|nr:MAG: glycosyltransferase family 2 protein [Candidatus Omnitrophota bacterium]
MKYNCDVVVLSFNRMDVTRQFVDSFLANTEYPCRLIMIDNGSGDGTKEYLCTLQSTDNCIIKVVLNRENRGFIRGMNQGIELSHAPYVCLANNDLIFTKGWLSEAISVLQKNSRIGLLNPNSNNLGLQPRSQANLETLAQDLRSNHRGEFVEMPFCIGFCMVTKREVIDKVAGYSEEFYPMFFEDTDYSMKVKEAGYLTGVAKSSYVYHLEHASMKQIGSRKESIFKESKEKCDKKWGKILRIAWIADGYKEVSSLLPEAVELARRGNYVWVFVRGRNLDRSRVFKEGGLFEHSGVNFVVFHTIFDLLWKILKKKKRYDVVIGASELTRCIFSRLGYNVLEKVDFAEINRIKKVV